MKGKQDIEKLEQSIKAIQKKLEEGRERFEKEPLTLEMDNSTGGTTIKPNPFVVEYQSLVRDYGLALKTYKTLTDQKESAGTGALSDIRERFKVAK